MMRKVEKPWGYELIWARTGNYVGKVLHVNAGCRLSLQYHRTKDETVYVQQGRIELLLGEDEGKLERLELGPGQSRHIPPATRHRMTALTDADIFEVSTPELEDVVRLEDDYGRTDGVKAVFSRKPN
jgi:mannose-6-phosphate isomerase-like protein (cupin superfamily)